ncbi:MAG: serine/threonine protein kinase [Verrucomicrobiae bacterium]|nr:serine/threonine protein kinase [Verrucomicrobiae bacterium]
MALEKDIEEVVNEWLRDFHAEVTSVSDEASPSGEAPGDTIENYTLIELVGEGGFGSVWRARQNQPVQRMVALKILKMGMDTREVLARFEQERQALALMDHPGIAQVLDAGATPSGRPFFVMELVNGLPITQFFEEQNLSTKVRLAVFSDVCHAVQHAHQKGIIHRDLKPSNILVSARENEPPQVKVIDFGIAKATGEHHLSDATLLTQANQMMGTPAYMSPEQLSGSLDVDTRSDVYSLGVLLYELLTGTPPFSKDELTSYSHDEMIRMVRERIPPKPSTRIKARPQTGRSMDAPQQAHLLRGDLDCIAMMALEKDPDRRYESASALAADIGRFLTHDPIVARPASTAYLLRQFARRNRVAVIGTLSVFAALAAGLAVASVLFLRERDSRQLANTEAEKSRQISQFLSEALQGAGPSAALGHDTAMMRSILDRTATRVGAELEGQPEVELAIRSAIGATYGDIHDYPNALEQYRRILDLQRRAHPENSPEVAGALLDLANTLEAQGEMRSAETHVLEAIGIYEQLDGDHRMEILFAKTLVAWIYMKTGRTAEAEAPAEEGYRAWLQTPAEERLGEAPKVYAIILHDLGRKEEAEAIYRKELEVWREIHGDIDHPMIANCLDNLGMVLLGNGKVQEAETILTEALDQGRRLYGDKCPHEDHVLSRLAVIAAQRGEWERELELLRDAVAVSARVYSPGHRYRKEPLNHLIKALFRQAEADTGGEARQRIAELEALSRSQDEVKIDEKRLAALKAGLR